MPLGRPTLTTSSPTRRPGPSPALRLTLPFRPFFKVLVLILGSIRGDDLAWLLALRPLREQIRGAVLPIDVLKLLNLGQVGGKQGGRRSQLRTEGLRVARGTGGVPGLG